MKKFLYKFDGLWALPVAFAIFVFAGYALQEIGGFGTGSYDIAFIQPLFLAAAVIIGATCAATWGLYFTFRDLYSYICGKEAKSLFDTLTPLQKVIISLSVFFLLIFLIVLVYLKLV